VFVAQAGGALATIPLFVNKTMFNFFFIYFFSTYMPINTIHFFYFVHSFLVFLFFLEIILPKFLLLNKISFAKI
jgi:hypothetical protein